MDKKLTNSEIVKALECCVNEKTCKNCPYSGRSCMTPLKRDTLDLINRLQAENEQLAKDKENLAYSFANTVGQKITAKTEAYKEFAERLKKHTRKMQSSDFSGEFWDKAVLIEDVDNLLKELVGE